MDLTIASKLFVVNFLNILTDKIFNSFCASMTRADFAKKLVKPCRHEWAAKRLTLAPNAKIEDKSHAKILFK